MIAEEQVTPRTFDVTVEGNPLSVTVTPGESTEPGVVQVTVDGQAFSVTVTTGGASADAGPAEASGGTCAKPGAHGARTPPPTGADSSAAARTHCTGRAWRAAADRADARYGGALYCS